MSRRWPAAASKNWTRWRRAGTGSSWTNTSRTAAATAAAVQIEGELLDGERVIATSQVTLDYVPGNSERRGGLFFREDPEAHGLKVRALGYAEP